jgi:hypothetical protein
MDIQAALAEVERWCAEQTAAGDPDAVDVDCHATVCITIGESAPPWRVRFQRRSSAGVSSPIAQLRYDFDAREWTLHHGALGDGWCADDEAVRAAEIGALLDEIVRDRAGRFQGLPPELRRRR